MAVAFLAGALAKFSGLSTVTFDGEEDLIGELPEDVYGDYKYVVLKDFEHAWTTPHRQHVKVLVPAGFLFDGVTGGWNGVNLRNACVHDWLYRSGIKLGLSKSDCDGVLTLGHRRLLVRFLGQHFWDEGNEAGPDFAVNELGTPESDVPENNWRAVAPDDDAPADCADGTPL